MGRKSDAGDRILAAGTKLFGQRAYASIGVAEIAAEAGVPKGSFYYFFPSKQALALAVVDAHWEQQRAEWLRILTAAEPLTERLRGLFASTVEVQRQAVAGTGAVVGCLFGNLALEVSAQDDPVRARLQQIFEEQIDIVEEAIRPEHAAGRSGFGTAREAAKAIVAQIEGMVLFAKLFNDPGQLDPLLQNSLRLLGLDDARTAA
ncbi:TetR/AcrR family transcriptional repressor of nem operon [Diaminobutyricimonas aerilata]|uniref:TetR/AcrR family transcriptional repressor of nem operon n=1 Tax=Diaminobutyricimonas aerilata TaxID=1162967 RepID=A0A2M9CNE9_9MICO|nr:TetR/AcrR family transcriptional regulator [Diaminobutyricimonas aerilata]PJJ73426.1 TetR/AcrR family transcriptional repressor of nem operon [Diaminobutyricimonas aerilata]